MGYPSLAAFLDSDESFMVYRRFGYLQARLLLDKQNQLRELESELDELDAEIKEAGDKHLPTKKNFHKTVDLPAELAEQREDLMERIEETYTQYGMHASQYLHFVLNAPLTSFTASLLTTAQNMVAFNRPASRDYQSVKNYFFNNRPQCEEEESWINCKEDLVSLRPGREHAWLDVVIENLLKWFHCSFIRHLFCSKETRRKSNSKNEVYYDRSRIEGLVAGIITIMLLVLLVVPVYILYHLVDKAGSGKTDAICIGTLLVFTLAFSAVLSLFTRARRHEILGAAAGYCAILVVFLGNVGDNKH